MSTLINLQPPSKRCFATEIKELNLDTLIKRKEELEKVMEYGLFPEWMIVKTSKSVFDVSYWDMYDVMRYRRLLLIELLDRSKKFELYPKLKFYF